MAKGDQPIIFESTEGMSETCRAALRDLLVAIADTKLLLGYHYGEWTFGPPELEAAVACCSLCQAELGHVRLIHGILNKHYGDDPDDLVENRRPEEFANISFIDGEIKDWAEFVAANYLVDLAATAVLFSLKDSAFVPLHMSLDKMLEEEKYHIHHGQGWFRTLASRSSETRKALEKHARRALGSVVEWFGPPDAQGDKALVEAGIKAESNSEILRRYTTELGRLAASLAVDLDLRKEGEAWVTGKAGKWDGWNAQSRRCGKSGPDEQILYHLRGSKNKVFKLN
ncbi:MAG: hypothetical protein D6743_06410 [Calditrichaeota bacterium]|nr:MAG: hypothetical protein D6743_06410 [Calditrichota bacterium]